MAGFYLDRTGPGPGSLSQVYGVFGTVDDTARRTTSHPAPD